MSTISKTIANPSGCINNYVTLKNSDYYLDEFYVLSRAFNEKTAAEIKTETVRISENLIKAFSTDISELKQESFLPKNTPLLDTYWLALCKECIVLKNDPDTTVEKIENFMVSFFEMQKAIGKAAFGIDGKLDNEDDVWFDEIEKKKQESSKLAIEIQAKSPSPKIDDTCRCVIL